IEIDQHVAAEYDVEAAERYRILQQIELAILHHAADLLADLPAITVLLEIFDQQGDRQAALHLELRIDALFGPVENLRREIGTDDIDLPAGELRAHLRQDHGQRIGLLAAGTGGTPDADRLRRSALLQQDRQDQLLELVERLGVAEEE